jgi:hypothetical protein
MMGKGTKSGEVKASRTQNVKSARKISTATKASDLLPFDRSVEILLDRLGIALRKHGDVDLDGTIAHALRDPLFAGSVEQKEWMCQRMIARYLGFQAEQIMLLNLDRLSSAIRRKWRLR